VTAGLMRHHKGNHAWIAAICRRSADTRQHRRRLRAAGCRLLSHFRTGNYGGVARPIMGSACGARFECVALPRLQRDWVGGVLWVNRWSAPRSRRGCARRPGSGRSANCSSAGVDAAVRHPTSWNIRRPLYKPHLVRSGRACLRHRR
jgi:hypothetical protein